MPTSSLTKNFVIDTEEMAQKFVNAIELSEKDKRKFYKGYAKNTRDFSHGMN